MSVLINTRADALSQCIRKRLYPFSKFWNMYSPHNYGHRKTVNNGTQSYKLYFIAANIKYSSGCFLL